MNNFIACQGATYIGGFTVYLSHSDAYPSVNWFIIGLNDVAFWGQIIIEANDDLPTLQDNIS